MHVLTSVYGPHSPLCTQCILYFYCIIFFLDYCKAPSCAKRSILQFKNMFLNGHTAALSSSTSKRKVSFVKLVYKSVMFCDFI